MSTVWDELERRIRERGHRVEERLALLALLREPDAAGRLEAQRRALLEAFEGALEALRAEAYR